MSVQQSFQLAFLLLAVCVFSVRGQMIIPLSIEGQVDNNVTFNCTSRDPGDTDNTLVEMRTSDDGQFTVLQEGSRLSRTDFPALSTTVYIFGPLTSDDNNLMIRCQSASSPTDIATVSVVFPPEISAVTPPNASFVVVEDAQQAFTVYIDVNGNPAPTFQWTRNGVALTNSASVYFNQSTIRLYHVRENSGDYQVMYSNNVDPAATHSFSLDVQYPPMFPTQPNCEEEDGVYMCSATIGASVTLVCNAAGNPSPTVTFYPSDISGNNDNNIVLSSVSMEDAGNYSCTASAQGFADVTRRFTLTVGGRPIHVSDLMVTINVNDGTITFTWTYDDSTNSVPITGFVLTIIPVNGGANITQTLLRNELSFEYSLNQLMAKVQYRVSVAARNTQGESELIFRPFTTPEDTSGGSSVFATASYMLSVLVMAVLALVF